MLRTRIYRAHKEMTDCARYYKAIKHMPNKDKMDEILEGIIEDNIIEEIHENPFFDIISDSDWIRTTIRPLKDDILKQF